MDLTQVARFHLAPGYDPADPDSWVWEDRSADVNHADGGITIRGGRADETSLVGAGSATLQVDNAGGHYCTANPYGRWYERLAQGCPARWGVVSGADTFDTPTTNGWGSPDVGISWSTAGVASEWSVSGGTAQKVIPTAGNANSAMLVGADARNGDATFTIMSPVVATGGGLLFGLQARYTDATDYLLFAVELGPAGVVTAQCRRRYGGIVYILSSTVLGWTYSASQRIRVRCQWDGHRLRIRAWPEASPEPATWDAMAKDTDCTGSRVCLYPWRLSANTNTSPVFHFDNLEVEAVEIVGTIERWPVDWDDTATVSWAGIEISGISERIAVGQEQLISPIRRQLSGLGDMSQGYWPLEDQAGVTVAASALPRRPVAACTGVDFGSSDCPPGAMSGAVLRTGGTSVITGNVTQWTAPRNGYAAMAFVRLPTLSPDAGSTLGNRLLQIHVDGSPITMWVIYATSGGWNIEGHTAAGTIPISVGSYAYTIDPTQWMAVQLEAEEDGLGNVDWRFFWNQVGATTYYNANGTFLGTANQVATVRLRAPVDGTAVSHLWAGDDLLPFVDPTFRRVSAGYASERASDRIFRLSLETGIGIGIESADSGDSEPLGIQKAGTFGTGVRAAEAADMGIQYENGAYLAYRPRTVRYNQPVWMTWAIAAAAGDVSGRPQPVDDNQRIRNRWTITREDGGETTAENEAHILRSGPRPDTATINIYAPDRLVDQASWRVHQGVWPEYRWPTLEVDFTDSPSQLALWRGRPFAPRVLVTGIPSQGPIGADADLIVEGWTQTITSDSWKVTVSCSSARPWDVGVYDESRYDSPSTTLTASAPAGQVFLSIVSAVYDDTWSVKATPYDWRVSGEVVTVTRVNQPGSIQGALDGSFESGVTTGWAASNGTVAASTAQVWHGTYAALLTVTGTPTATHLRTASGLPVIAGSQYRTHAWVYSAAGYNVVASVDWYDASVAYLSTTSTTITVPAGVWTYLQADHTAPPSAVTGRHGVSMGGSPATGLQLWADDLDMSLAGGMNQTAWVTREVNGISKTLPSGSQVCLATPARYAL